jgi:hypothetical protein
MKTEQPIDAYTSALAGEASTARFDLNAYLMGQRDVNNERVYNNDSFPLAKRITCKDGFSLSVQATHGAYCSPRQNIGPWHLVEVGFPSAEPELIMSYAESPDAPTETVYGYVPVELVEQLIALHSGSAS